MDSVFDYTIPVLHPLAVHFPLALLTAAALVAGVWLVLGTAFWHRCLLLLTALGTAGAAFAYFTGDAMKAQSEGVPIVDELVGLHEDMALYLLIAASAALLGTALSVARALGSRKTPTAPFVQRLLIVLLIFLTTGLALWTGHIGGTMVWGVSG